MLSQQEVVYGTVLQAFRSQGTHAHLLVAERAAQSQRNRTTVKAESYQRESRTATQSLVWQRVFSARSADSRCLSASTPSEARSIKVEAGSGVCARKGGHVTCFTIWLYPPLGLELRALPKIHHKDSLGSIFFCSTFIS